MKRKQVVRLLGWRAVIAAVLIGAVLGSGAVNDTARAMPLASFRYVAPSGNDSANNCTSSANPCATIQRAVDQAASGDEIRIAEGSYLLTGGADQIVYLAKSVTLRGGYRDSTNFTEWDPSTYFSVLDAGGAGRCIYITGSAQPLVEGLRITGGNAAGLGGGPRGEDAGGGVYVSGAAPTLRNNQISGNTAKTGGGLWLANSNAVLVDNTISGNTATWYGGGLGLYQSPAEVRDNAITNNTATGAAGGVYVEQSAASLEGNTISDNDAGSTGGGARIVNSAATLTGNDVSGNTATTAGGGLYLQNSPAALIRNAITANAAGSGGGIYINSSAATLDGNAISGNTSGGDGGGVYLSTASATLVNTWVLENQAADEGSGVYVSGNAPVLRHTTLAGNSGGEGSGIHATHVLTNYSSISLINTILVSQTVGVFANAGSAVTLTSTLWGSGAWANGSDWGGAGTVIRKDEMWGDPLFVDAAAGDYHLAQNLAQSSPAIDVGADSGVDADADGQARPHYDGYDLGADEWWPLLALKTLTPDAVAGGDLLTYTLVLSNVSALNIPAEVRDPLHPYVTFVGPLVYNNGSGGHASGVVTWTGTVTMGASVAIAWTVQVSESAPFGTEITNTAVITDLFGVFATSSPPAVTGQWVFLPFVRRG